MGAIEKRYAKALLDSNDTDKENELNYLEELAEAFSKDSELKKIMLDPIVSKNEKINVIKGMLPNCKNNVFYNFLLVLIDKGRLENIPGIAQEYRDLLRARNNELFITIISASKLDENEVSGIAEKYRKLYNAEKVSFNLEIDEEIIGGVKVVIGNKVYDGSLKTMLRNML